jgi:hypothetical protein
VRGETRDSEEKRRERLERRRVSRKRLKQQIESSRLRKPGDADGSAGAGEGAAEGEEATGARDGDSRSSDA